MGQYIRIFSLVVLLGIQMAVGQPNEVWQEKLIDLSEKGLAEVLVQQNENIQKISLNDGRNLLEQAKKVLALENPDQRSLPTVEGRLTFFSVQHDILVIELVKDHWFNGVYMCQGKVTPFVLKDEGNHFLQTVEKIMNPQPEIQLCSECCNKMFATALGECSACKGTTESIGFKYCSACAAQKGVCQACGKKLK